MTDPAREKRPRKLGGVSVEHLTGATEPRRPDVCRSCVWWQGTGERGVDKRRWIQDVEDDFGAWGEIYLDGDRHVASLQYGPAPAFPRARTCPRGRPRTTRSRDVRLPLRPFQPVVAPEPVPGVHRRVPRAPRDGDRGVRVVHAADAEFAERFLHHRTIFPRDFLADYGFATLRSAGRVELMRLELGGLQPSTEDGRVAQAVRRAAEIIRPPGLAEPARAGRGRLRRRPVRLAASAEGDVAPNGTTTAPRSWLPVPLGPSGGAPRTHRRSAFPAPVSQPLV